MQKWVNFEVIVEANLEVTVAVMEDLRTWKALTGPGRLVESKFKKLLTNQFPLLSVPLSLEYIYLINLKKAKNA